MKIIPDYMDKSLTVITKEGKSFSGLCWGVYGSVQCEEEYGRYEDALELFIDGQAILLFDSDIESIRVA